MASNMPPRLALHVGASGVMDHLLAGGVVPFPDGRLARPVGGPRTCERCNGKGTEPDPKGEWMDPPSCMDCDGRKQTVEIEYIADPWVLAPWAKVDGRKSAGPIERRAQTGEVAAIITPMVGGYLIDICHNDVDPYRVTIHGHAELRPYAKPAPIGEVARRLADAELHHHGFTLRSH